MGKESVKIISGLDVNKLIEMLNEALSEEWLAYYQYWIGGRVMEGNMRPSIETEFEKHANEELGHAAMLVDRIIQLEGKPVLSPEEWFKLAKCKYMTPNDPFVGSLLNDNLSAERCAIDRYKSIVDYTFGKDHVTYKMALSIMEDEMEHEQDIQNWIEDMRIAKERA